VAAVCPEDGGGMFLRNVGSHKIYVAPHPRRQHSFKNIKSRKKADGAKKYMWVCLKI
jgi:hypothetical protein